MKEYGRHTAAYVTKTTNGVIASTYGQ